MVGRTAELKYLIDFYKQDKSSILVIYGQKNIGRTTLLKEFAKGRLCHYHMARACSEKEQMLSLKQSLPDIEQGDNPGKRIIIIDEFQNIVKVRQRFIEDLALYIEKEENNCRLLIILASSSVSWIENSMISKIGKAALSISGLYKIKELGFEDIKEYFPGFHIREHIEAYALLGGMPGLWKYFDDRLSIKENICRTILDTSAPLYKEAERCVSEELRETSVYNTILAALASGKRKLNDLYEYTGFSRAKISVYLKNLMELEIVEKVFSYDSGGRENTQKGIYRISSHLIDFYFTFLYDGGRKLFFESPEEFYDSDIEPFFSKFTDVYFKKVCMQHMEGRNRSQDLSRRYGKLGEWVGKEGNIDMIAQDGEGNTLAGLCCWEKPVMTFEAYQSLILRLKKAKLTSDCIYLFSGEGFDDILTSEAEKNGNINLVYLREL